AGLMSNGGVVLSHQNEELIGTNYFESEAMQTHPERDRVIQAIKEGETAVIQGQSGVLKTEVYRLFSPIHVSGTDTPWSAFLAAPVAEVNQVARSVTVTITVVSALILILLTLIILLVTRSIVLPLRVAVEHGQEMA